MANMKLDIDLKSLADSLNSVRTLLEQIKAEAASAEQAIGGMATGAARRVRRASQTQQQEGVGATPILSGVPNDFGLTIDTTRKNWAIHPNSVASDPALISGTSAHQAAMAGFVSQADRMRSIVSGQSVTSMQDLASVRVGQLKYGQTGDIDKLISKMESKGASDVDKAIAEEARSLVMSMRKQVAEVDKLVAATKESGISESELQKRRAALAEATKKLTDATERVADSERSMKDIVGAGGGGTGGGGGGPGGIDGFFKNINWGQMAARLSQVGAVISAVGNAGNAALGMSNAAYREVAGANLATMEAAGAIGASQWQRGLGAMDLTKGENLVRYFGNIVQPEVQYNYLGTNGRAAAMAEAQEMTKRDLGLARTERMETISRFGVDAATKVLGGIGAGAMGGAVFAGVGAIPGAIMGGAAGLASVFAGGTGLYQSLMQNQYTQSQMTGDEWWLPEGAGKTIQNKWAVQQRLREQNRMQSQQDAELEGSPEARRMAMGYDLFRQGIAVRRAGTAMVGGRAVSGFERNQEEQRQDKAESLYNMILNQPSHPEFAIEFDRRREVAREKQNERLSKLSPFGEAASNLGMLTSELASVQNQLRSVGGGSAERLVRLGRAGVGSVDQLLGNVAGLAQVAGPQRDLKQLEDIMAKAVSRGFDTANTAQQFVQSVTALTGAVQSGSVGSVASMLQAVQSGMGGAGDLVSLQAAQSGLSRLSQLTTAGTGLMGAVKAFGIFGSGGSIAGGGSIMQGMNVMQAQGASDVIASSMRSGDMEALGSDPRTRQAIMASRGDLARRLYQKDWNSLSAEEKRNVMSRIQGQMGDLRSNMLMPFRGVVEALGGRGAYEGFQSRAKEALAGGDQKRYQQVLAEMAALGANALGMEDVSSAMAAFTSDLTATGGRVGLSKAQQNAALAGAMGRGDTAARDEALNRRQRFMNQQANLAARKFTGTAGVEDVGDYFQAQGGAFEAEVDGRRETIDAGRWQKLSAEQRRQVASQQTHEKLIFGMQTATASMETASSSVITGFTTKAIADMASAFKDAVMSARSDDDRRGVITTTLPKMPGSF